VAATPAAEPAASSAQTEVVAPAAAASSGDTATPEEAAGRAPDDDDRAAGLPGRRDDADTATEPASDTDDRVTDTSPGADAATTDVGRTAVIPAEASHDDRTPPPPPAPQQRATPVPPADAPPPPRRGSNRLVGTAWALLAALIFEIVYLAAYALLIVVVYGPSSVSPALSSLNKIGLTWLPVILFVLFYELTVLLLNRAGRFAYVLSSLIVAAIVYLLTTFLALAMQSGGIANEGSFGQALIAPQIVLIPLVAREVMLWTGLAVGARGRRVRRRNRAAQEQYERERFARSVQDDGADTPA
jgi:hypothetical protein